MRHLLLSVHVFRNYFYNNIQHIVDPVPSFRSKLFEISTSVLKQVYIVEIVELWKGRIPLNQEIQIQ